MNRREYLLTCLAEECTEVGQRVSKALRFGLGEIQPGQPFTNAERIAEEMGDLCDVYRILVNEGVLPVAAVNAETKLAKIERFMAISREQGTLQEEREQ
jgi:NTP pyrophosphatase (non-canonical NTP hydrolase)|tara:strand:+ start:4324 stop:4620 length:297 start_codon:yes stop_codon:yes gene_type:complete